MERIFQSKINPSWMPGTVWQIRPGWVGRGVLFGITTALHLGLGMSLMLMHPPDPMTPWLEVPGRLEVRLIDTLARSSVPGVQPRPTSEKPQVENRRVAVVPTQHKVARPMDLGPTFDSTKAADVQTPPLAIITTTHAQHSVSTDYVPGGGLFDRNGLVARTRVSLPGAPVIKNAPRFRMADPRSQGVAGVVRIIGSFTGAVDGHCVDLDAWEGMSADERIAHHVSEADMGRIRENYGCEEHRVPRKGR